MGSPNRFQTGLAYGRATVAAPVFTVNALGTGAIGPAGLTTLGLSFAWAADIRTFVMAQAATGLKLAEVTRLEHRRLFWAILLSVVVTLSGSVFAVMQIAYSYGGINLTGWQFWPSRIFWQLGYAQHQQRAADRSLAFNIYSRRSITHVSFNLYQGAIRWFSHPPNRHDVIGLTHPVNHVWFSVFLAWLFKYLILKYGGAGLYTRLRPLFRPRPGRIRISGLLAF